MNKKSKGSVMTKLIAAFLAISFVISIVNPAVRAADNGEVEYKIRNAAQFKEIMNSLSSGAFTNYTKISLETDITLTGIDNYPYNPTVERNTVFDGKGHSISGINSETADGLFNMNFGTIKNLTLRNCKFQVTHIVALVGGIVADNYGTVSNCHVQNININVNSDYYPSTGGIVGLNDKGIIRNCTASGTIMANSRKVGGIAGESQKSTIENCANFSSVESTYNTLSDLVITVGGICGCTDSTIRNCYNSSSVTAASKTKGTYVGAIAGWAVEPASVSYVYSTSDINVGSGTVTNSYPGLTDTYIKSESFVNTLNNNVGDNQEWLLWSHTAGTYPIPAQQSSAINISKDTINTRYSNKTISLGFTTTGMKSGDVTVTSSKTSVASVNTNNSVTIKGPGVTKLRLSFGGNDRYKAAATKTITLIVKPKKVSGVKLTAKKKKINISWKKTKCSGYIIQYSTDKNFSKNVKTVTINKSKATKRTIKKLKSRKVYYIRVIAFSKDGSDKIKGAASAVKKVRVR